MFEMRRVGKKNSEGAAGWRIRMVADMGMEVERELKKDSERERYACT